MKVFAFSLLTIQDENGFADNKKTAQLHWAIVSPFYGLIHTPSLYQ